jgi:hypothetical protein
LAVVTAVVVAYVALGLIFQPDPDTYLLLGVPITLAFQTLVQRRPIRALWLRQAPPVRLSPLATLLAALLAVRPALTVLAGWQAQQWVIVAYGILAVGGALPAAWAISRLDRRGWRDLGACLATGGAVGILFALLPSIQAGFPAREDPGRSLATFLSSLLLYIPVLFVLEEVLFRGALDTYVAPDGEMSSLSLFWVAGLWGLWHLPLMAASTRLAGLPSLVAVQVAVGVPLAIYWRHSGNLAVPAITHALASAARNALL